MKEKSHYWAIRIQSGESYRYHMSDFTEGPMLFASRTKARSQRDDLVAKAITEKSKDKFRVVKSYITWMDV